MESNRAMKYRFNKESKKAFGLLVGLVVIGIFMTIQKSAMWKYSGFAIILLSVIAVGAIIYFFRDPERHSSAAEEMIVAPADGLVVRIEQTLESRHLKGPAWRIAIFMHIGNVHVQRVPSAGTLCWTQHQPGRFLPILHSRASFENEQRWYAFENNNRNYTLVQIAGILAKRTISWLKPQHFYQRGERLGMIALGSEIDIYLPLSTSIVVKVGEKVIAGETIIGRWN